MTAETSEKPSNDPLATFFDRIARLMKRVQPQLDPALKALNITWLFSLSVGGVIFIVYSFSIGFFPELGLQDSITLLIGAVLTGVFLLLWLGIIFLLPGWMFVRKKEDEKYQVWWFLLILCYFFSISLALAYEQKKTSEWSFIIGIVIVTFLATFLYYIHTKEWDRAAHMAIRALMASAFSAIVLWVILSFSFSISEIVQLCVVVISFNVFVVIAPHFPGGQKNRLLWPAMLFTGFIVALLAQTGVTFIPNAVMRIYKFGHFQAASLDLKGKSCEIARDKGLQEGSPCQFTNVMIRSRLGSTYYIEARKEKTAVCFTVPSSEVLSWSFAAEKQPQEADWQNGCNKINRNPDRAERNTAKPG